MTKDAIIVYGNVKARFFLSCAFLIVIKFLVVKFFNGQAEMMACGFATLNVYFPVPIVFL